MRERDLVERIWRGHGTGARVARVALEPLSWIYGGVVRARGALYDAGVLASRALPLPAIGIGNLTVGGTGKTPVAAWMAAELARRGGTPAILLRGYGGDEILVHERLNPGLVVVAAADRRAAAAEAVRRGCDVAVLDDAFQHRRVRRLADIVLVSADRWSDGVRLLPAGPWRETPRALRRASMILVTRKAATHDAAARVRASLALLVRRPIAIAHLAPDALCAVGAPMRSPLESVQDRRVLAVSGIGDPQAFEQQLIMLGAHVESAAFPDHHRLRDDEVQAIATRAERADMVVCTLKDAVKLAERWPRVASPIWYVSQRVEIEHGSETIAAVLTDVLAARPSHTSPILGA